MFVERLQHYYDESPTYKKKMINWWCVNNHECSFQNFELMNAKVDKAFRRNHAINYVGNSCGNKQLKDITDEDIKYLDLQMEELDGTLLGDIVHAFMKEHKIFV